MTATPDDAAIRQRGIKANDEAEPERQLPIRGQLNGIPYGRPVIPAAPPNGGYEIGYTHPADIDVEWKAQAACASLDQSLFFPDRGRGKARAAIEICNTCPVTQQCLAYGGLDDVNRSAGVFGGQTSAQRRLQSKPPLPEIL